MSDTTIIYIGLLIGFILLIIIIRGGLFGKIRKEHPSLMYYKLDLKERKITTITYAILEEETKKLNNIDYELILLPDLEAFINQRVNLPEKSFLIILNETYGYSLKKALPLLIKEHISLIIFLPIFISTNNNNYQQKDAQQLNEFIFSEEFKNIFSFTQPNNELHATIL